jgi:hypothetical protein
MDPLFPALPEDLGALSDEELNELIDQHVAAIRAIRENDEAFIGELTGNEVLEQLRGGVEQWRTLTEHRDGRTAEIENYESSVAGLTDEVLSTTDEPEPEEPEPSEPEPSEPEPSEPTEPEGEATAEGEQAETEVVVASAPVRRPPRASRERAGQPEQSDRAVLRASAGLESVVRPGEPLDREGLRDALIYANETTSAKPGEQTKVIVATARFNYPEERRLDNRNATYNWTKINPAKALVATGGLCAPFPSFYDLPVISVADRPVRDALVSFQASRGGVSVPTNLSMADVAEGVGIVTAEDDEAGGTFGVKTCVTIDCEPWTDYNIDAVYACVTHGVLNARAWPERVDAVEDLLAAQHAKIAEINLLDQLSAGSTAVTDEKKYGAVSTLLQGILKAASAYRSRHRTALGVRLQVLMPEWVPDLLLADMVHGQFDRFHPRTFISTLFNEAGVDVAYYKDEVTGSSQIYPAQAAGTLNEFLTTVVWFLFDRSHWLFLDFGELNLGIIRDSDLATTNDFMAFRETFEGTAPVGIESLKITSTVCPDGTYAPAATAFTC